MSAAPSDSSSRLGEDPDEPRVTSGRSGTHQRIEVWLVPVAVLFVWVVQWRIGTLDRFLGWDEAVYFSQVAKGQTPAILAAQRSPLVPIVLWPLGVFTDSVVALRSFIVLGVSGGILWLGRGLCTVGIGAQVGLGLFLVSALPSFHFGELSPNLWVGLIAAWVALLVAVPRGRRLTDLALLALAAAALVALRPPDGIMFLLGAGMVMLGMRSLRDLKRLAALTAGGLVGLVVWLAPTVVRFGGFTQAMESSEAKIGLGFRLTSYIDMLDGPLRASSLDGVSFLALVPWLLILGGALFVMATARSAGIQSEVVRRFAAVTLVGGGLLGLEYVVLVSNRWVRFIYPSWLLIAMGVGALVFGLVPRKALVGVWVVFPLVAVSQLMVIHPFATQERAIRAPLESVGIALADRADGEPCAAVTEFGAPSIGFASHCLTSILGDPGQARRWLEGLAGAGAVTFAVVAGDPTDSQRQLGDFERIDVGTDRFWSILQMEP